MTSDEAARVTEIALHVARRARVERHGEDSDAVRYHDEDVDLGLYRDIVEALLHAMGAA